MTVSTLFQIQQKMRRLIGSPSTLQIADVDINNYINSFYLYDFPAQFRSLQLKDVYTFDTMEGFDVYPFPSELYTTVQMPCYVAKREVKLFNDQWSFFAANYNWQSFENFAYGNGTPGPYTGTISSVPILRSTNNNPNLTDNPSYPAYRVQNVLITANTFNSTGAGQSTVNITDDGQGNLIGDTNGQVVINNLINYETGAITVSFNQNIPIGNQIQVQFNPVQESIPLSILFYQNQFTLRPVPDQGYTVEITCYRQPSQALMDVPNGQGTPDLSEWWETIAVGAAKKFYEDSLDMDAMGVMDILLKQKYALNMTRTYAQIGTQRVSTMFADQLQYNYGSSIGWGGSF